MPYVGGEIASLFHTEPTEATLVRMANDGGDKMVELTVKNTPIGFPRGEARGFRGGNLRSSWYQLPVRRHRSALGSGWESGVATDVDYAPFVEHGTGKWGPKGAPYIIEPRRPGGVLHWIDPVTGKDVFARRVRHPGSPGHHMVAIAAAVVEGTLGEVLAAALEEWQRAQEELAD